MSALPFTIYPPIRVNTKSVLASSDGASVLESALLTEITADLRAAVMRGHAVHFGDGTSLPARDAIMAAAAGSSCLEEMLEVSMRKAIDRDPHAGAVWEEFVTAAIRACAQELVDRIAERERITFGAKR